MRKKKKKKKIEDYDDDDEDDDDERERERERVVQRFHWLKSSAPQTFREGLSLRAKPHS
jgi:hypothetical protein